MHRPARGHLWPTNRQVWAIARELCRAAAIDFPETRDEASDLIDALRAATARLDGLEGSEAVRPDTGACPGAPRDAASTEPGGRDVDRRTARAGRGRAAMRGASAQHEEDDVPTYG